MSVLAHDLNFDGTRGALVRVLERDSEPGYVWCRPVDGGEERRVPMRRLLPEGFTASARYETLQARRLTARAAQQAFAEALHELPRLSAYDVKALPERKGAPA